MLCMFCKDKVRKEDAGELECLYLAYEDVAQRTVSRIGTYLTCFLSLRYLSFVHFDLQGRHEMPKYFLTSVSIKLLAAF